MYDPSCAEIYSECNYTGDSVSVCDRVNSFPKSGWNKPVNYLWYKFRLNLISFPLTKPSRYTI